MAPRSFWKGYLKFSLVSCSVAMTPAISERGKVRVHTLNRQTGNRVQSRYVDADTGKPVKEDDEVSGYQLDAERYVVLEDEELEAVALESTRTIDIGTFVPRDSIGWIWLDKPHHLVPDDKVGEEAYSVIRDAMAATDTVGISQLVLYRRERAMMLEPSGKGIVAWTLRYGDEVRDAEGFFQGIDAGKPDKKLLALIEKLNGERSVPWSPDLVQDPVQERLLEIIAAKKKKQAKPARPSKAEAPQETAGNVVSIMDALRKSLASEKRPPR